MSANYSHKGLAMSPAGFAERVTFDPETRKSDWYCPRHLSILNDLLVDVATGKINRLMTFISPRHGKSELLSAWFPVWYLGCYPDREVILASYNADFAEEWGQKARDRMDEFGWDYFGLKIRPDRRASNSWGLVDHRGKIRRGGLKTTGVNGGLTGKGAKLLLIDDPVKDHVEALSPTTRQSVWDWYAAAARTRLAPGGAICLTMTPWHSDDLGGRILDNQASDWTVLRMPGLAEDPVPPEIRATRKGYDALVGAPDPLGREPGEPIWPFNQDGEVQFGVEHFDEIKKLDPFWFDALQMCHPRPRDGGFFKREWFDGKTIAIPHREASHVRFWDTASSLNQGDWTVGVLMGCHNELYYVEHIERFRIGPGDRDKRIRDVAFRDKDQFGGRVRTVVEQGGGGGGKTEAEGIVKALAGFTVSIQVNQANKEARADPFASQCQAGNVKLVAGSWHETFLDELCGFPNGKNDDQVDAASGAFAQLALGGAYHAPIAETWEAWKDPYAAMVGGESW